MKPDLKTHWIMACVELHTEIPPDPEDEDGDKRLIAGYFRNFGVTAATEGEACELVEAEISDGEISWPESKISVDVVTRLSPEIISRSGDWTERGIWYRSGRVLFPKE